MRSALTRRGALATLGGLIGVVAACGRDAPPASGDDGEGTPVRYSYGEHPSQFAELTVPATTPAPVVVVIHGGYWSAAYGIELGRPLAADLAARGMAVCNVEYRRVGEGGGWPATGQDVAAAVDALRDRSAGLDLRRVVALGHSAGGQLAGWLAARRGAPVGLTGMVSQAGVLDLVRGVADGLGGGAVEAFLGGTPPQRPDAYADASPTARLPLGVPSVCVHGTADTVVPISQSRDFVAAARSAGDRSELRTYDGGHFDLITVGTQAWQTSVDAVRGLLGV